MKNTKIQKILCKIGFHKFVYATDFKKKTDRILLLHFMAIRCKKCGKYKIVKSHD